MAKLQELREPFFDYACLFSTVHAQYRTVLASTNLASV